MPSKILIVEDNQDSREMLAAIVAAHGYPVLTADDGQQGLAMALSERPAVIITDLQMPNLDGIGLIKQLRAMPAFADVPIIVLTAYQSGSTREALRVGANHAMRKPISIEWLMLAVEDLVKRAKCPCY